MMRARFDMLALESHHSRHDLLGDRQVEGAQAREQRLLLVGSVAWRRFTKIAQRRLQRLALASVQKAPAPLGGDACQQP